MNNYFFLALLNHFYARLLLAKAIYNILFLAQTIPDDMMSVILQTDHRAMHRLCPQAFPRAGRAPSVSATQGFAPTFPSSVLARAPLPEPHTSWSAHTLVTFPPWDFLHGRPHFIGLYDVA